MACGISESFGRVFPNKVYATLEFRACRVTVVQSPLRGKNNPSDGRVHGNRTLSVVSVSKSTNYELYGDNTNGGMVPGIAFSQGCRERISGVADITIIYIHSITVIYIYVAISVINATL